MMVTFMVSEAIALHELDPVALNTIYGADMHTVRADDFHMWPYLVAHVGFSLPFIIVKHGRMMPLSTNVLGRPKFIVHIASV